MTIDHRFYVGIVAACISVTACDLYVLLRQYRWDWLSLLIDIISILLVFFWTGVWSVNKNYSGEFYRAGAQTLGTLGVWCCFFVAVIACLLPRFTLDFCAQTLNRQMLTSLGSKCVKVNTIITPRDTIQPMLKMLRGTGYSQKLSNRIQNCLTRWKRNTKRTNLIMRINWNEPSSLSSARLLSLGQGQEKIHKGLEKTPSIVSSTSQFQLMN